MRRNEVTAYHILDREWQFSPEARMAEEPVKIYIYDLMDGSGTCQIKILHDSNGAMKHFLERMCGNYGSK